MRTNHEPGEASIEDRARGMFTADPTVTESGPRLLTSFPNSSPAMRQLAAMLDRARRSESLPPHLREALRAVQEGRTTLGDALRLPGWPAAGEIILPDEVGEARRIIADQGGPAAVEEAQS